MKGGQLLYHLGDQPDRPKWLLLTFNIWASKMAIGLKWLSSKMAIGLKWLSSKMAIGHLGDRGY